MLVTSAYAATNTSQDGGVMLLVLLAAYMFPAIVAWRRRHANSNAIAVLNLLLGWTVIGWIVAIIWASTSNTNPSPRRRSGTMTLRRYADETDAEYTARLRQR